MLLGAWGLKLAAFLFFLSGQAIFSALNILYDYLTAGPTTQVFANGASAQVTSVALIISFNILSYNKCQFWCVSFSFSVASKLTNGQHIQYNPINNNIKNYF